MKWVLTFLANEPYIDRALQTIVQARTVGEWHDDIVLLGPESLLAYKGVVDRLQQLDVRFVSIPFQEVKSVKSFWDMHKDHENYEYIQSHPYIYQKLFVFHSLFKAWDIVFYLDSGCVIQGSLQRIKNTCTPRHFLYAHSDSYPFYNYRSLDCQFCLEIAEPRLKEAMEATYPLDIDYFQSTLMIYNTKILEENTLERLFQLAEQYPMSTRMDQGILNLYWTCERKLWRQIPLQDEEGFLYNYLEINGCKTAQYLILKVPRWVK
jgi:hypothetical protein